MAARAMATVGEISFALEKVFGRHKAEQELVTGIYAQDLRSEQAVDRRRAGQGRAVLEEPGHKPRIFICKLGQDGHDRGQEVVGAAFSDLGFDVVLGPLFQTPEEAARQAVEKMLISSGQVRLPLGITSRITHTTPPVSPSKGLRLISTANSVPSARTARKSSPDPIGRITE